MRSESVNELILGFCGAIYFLRHLALLDRQFVVI